MTTASAATDAAVRRSSRTLALVIPAFRMGGAERVMVNLANELASRGYSVHLCAARVDGPFRDLVQPDVRVVDLGEERARSVVPALGRVLRTVRPGAVLTTLGSNISAGLLRLVRVLDARLVMREGNTTSAFLHEVAQSSPSRARLYRATYRTVYRAADAVVCQSHAMAADLGRITGLPPGRITVIYNPVDVELVRRLSGEPCELERRPGPHLVAVGRCAPQKGYDLLVRAVARLRRARPTAEAWILGAGDGLPALRALAAELGVTDGIHLPGAVENPFPYVRAADLFVSSSRYEGVSNSMLEALVCGTPVLASDCPSGVREIITPGTNGWLCPPDDPDLLSDAVHHALATPLGKRRDTVSQQAADRFGLAAAADAYCAVLFGT